MGVNNYRADIDGLRAVAVLAVVFYHTGGVFSVFSGGFVGVDVFYVISGFLITRIILTELFNDKFSFKEFWLRRSRRILPAIIVVCLFCLVFGWFILTPKNFTELGESAAAQSVFLTNIYFWLQTGYFQEPMQTMPLIHTWSLSIEEQYYIIFPVFLSILFRIKRSWIPHIIILAFLSSFLLSLWGTTYHPSATFYLFPTRAWELLIGSILAIILLHRQDGLIKSSWINELIGLIGLIAIIASIFLFDKTIKFPGFFALLPSVGSALIILSGSNRTFVARVLSTRPLVAIGLISYSLYLWHWPVLAFFKYATVGKLGGQQISIALMIIFSLSYLSYRFVETPTRTKRVLPKEGTFALSACFSLAILGLAGIFIHYSDGIPSRIPANARQYADAAYLVDQDKLCVKFKSTGLNTHNICRVGNIKNDLPKILLLGDSHAGHLQELLRKLSERYNVEVLNSGMCAYQPKTPPRFAANEDCKKKFTYAVNALKADKIKHIIVANRWSLFTENFEPDNTDGINLTPLELSKLRDDFKLGMLSFIKDYSPYVKKITIVAQIPEHTFLVPKALYLAAMTGEGETDFGRPVEEHLKRSIFSTNFFKSLDADKVSVIDPTEEFCGQNSFCIVENGGRSLYSDNDHLTLDGTLLLEAKFKSIFTDL